MQFLKAYYRTSFIITLFILMKNEKTYTTFPLKSASGAYLTLRLLGAVFIRGKRLKEDGTYFKAREINHINLQNFVNIPFKTKRNRKTSLQ